MLDTRFGMRMPEDPEDESTFDDVVPWIALSYEEVQEQGPIADLGSGTSTPLVDNVYLVDPSIGH